jgi:hypothetical protein
MKIKTNLRAGLGGASGVGGNSVGSHSSLNAPVVMLYNVGFYVDPTIGVTRCVGV